MNLTIYQGDRLLESDWVSIIHSGILLFWRIPPPQWDVRQLHIVFCWHVLVAAPWCFWGDASLCAQIDGILCRIHWGHRMQKMRLCPVYASLFWFTRLVYLFRCIGWQLKLLYVGLLSCDTELLSCDPNDSKCTHVRLFVLERNSLAPCMH